MNENESDKEFKIKDNDPYIGFDLTMLEEDIWGYHEGEES
jgi:hypothetical protein